MSQKERTELGVIGSVEFIDVASHKNIPAKIDTGADSSSIWASHICVRKDGTLEFKLFGEKSPFYTGETIRRKDFQAVLVRSSSGHEQIRYRTHLSTKIAGRRIKALFTLSDRRKNIYPVLIGRRSISGKFIVDVSKNHNDVRPKKPKIIKKYLEKDPYEFHEKYFKDPNGIKAIKLKEGKIS